MTYKTLSLLLFVAVIGLSIALALHKAEDPEIRNKTIKSIHKHRDSLKSVILATQDTLLIVRQRLETIERERNQAMKERQLAIEKYESIRFKRYPTDSARINAWAEVFPSLRHSR